MLGSGTAVGRLATYLVPFAGCPTSHSGGENEKWPTSRRIGDTTRVVSWVPNASDRRKKSAMANKWAHWVHNAWRLRGPQCFIARGKLSSGPQMWGISLLALPFGGPSPSERGRKLAVAHKLFDWLHNYCRPRGPQCFRGGRQSANTHKWAVWLHNTPRYWGPQRFRAGANISNCSQMGGLAA